MGSKTKIKEALRMAAVARASKPDIAILTVLANRLSNEPEADVLDALERLSEMPRKEFEPALPDMGTLLAMVQGCAVARRNRENIQDNKKLFYFTCDVCGFSQSGFFAPSAPETQKRHCRSMYMEIGSRKLLPFGQICGHDMRIEQFKPYDGGAHGSHC